MKSTETILGLCGSLRAESWNLKLLRIFLDQMKKELEFSPNLWPSLDMPLVNEDLERAPLDPRITAFQQSLKKASLVAIASPEYNGSLSPALKNAIDWATRGENIWAGKIVVLLSASPGSLGGARGLIQLRTVLSGIKAWVIPEQVQLPFCDKALKEGVPDSLANQISSAGKSLQHLASRLL